MATTPGARGKAAVDAINLCSRTIVQILTDPLILKIDLLRRKVQHSFGAAVARLYQGRVVIH